MAPSTTSKSECSPCSWPGRARQPALLGPAAVAVHDDRDVRGTRSAGTRAAGRRTGAGWAGGRRAGWTFSPALSSVPEPVGLGDRCTQHRPPTPTLTSTRPDTAPEGQATWIRPTQIEQQITVLLRRVQRIHLSTTTGDVDLERSAYGIMCKLADEGPQRLGALAHRVRAGPATITRQVQALEEIGLAAREDRPLRPAGVDPRPHAERPRDPRQHPRPPSRPAPGGPVRLAEADRDAFGRLLDQFNVTQSTGCQPHAEGGSGHVTAAGG